MNEGRVGSLGGASEFPPRCWEDDEDEGRYRPSREVTLCPSLEPLCSSNRDELNPGFGGRGGANVELKNCWSSCHPQSAGVLMRNLRDSRRLLDGRTRHTACSPRTYVHRRQDRSSRLRWCASPTRQVLRAIPSFPVLPTRPSRRSAGHSGRTTGVSRSHVEAVAICTYFGRDQRGQLLLDSEHYDRNVRFPPLPRSFPGTAFFRSLLRAWFCYVQYTSAIDLRCLVRERDDVHSEDEQSQVKKPVLRA